MNRCPEYEAHPIDDFGNTHVGVCHICHKDGVNIGCCVMCQHWFCYPCRENWWPRPWEAIKQAIKDAWRGPEGRCCGPKD